MNITCLNCGKVFQNSHKTTLYCSRKCYLEHYDFIAICEVNKIPPEQRFWEKVDRQGIDDCWNWEAGILKGEGRGYGTFKFDGGSLAHRFSYSLHYGEIPPGIEVCHKCDNPKCVNPNHLFLGTHQDNMNDKKAKKRGRSARGEKHYRVRLTSAKVLEIRRLFGTKSITAAQLARMFNVGDGTISSILNNQSWKHI